MRAGPLALILLLLTACGAAPTVAPDAAGGVRADADPATVTDAEARADATAADSAPDAAAADATAADATADDASADDATAADGGPLDAGALDAALDAGLDAATPDAVVDDAGAGAGDAAPLDAGAPSDAGAAEPDAALDAGALDAGPPDAGAPDAALYTRPIVGTGAPLAALGAGGRLEYRRYPAQGQTAADHVLPDFSHAGYRGGGVALPAVAARETLDPVGGDERARVQAALDRVSALTPDTEGRRGAVLLRRGRWSIGDTLRITASGVVLRGEGQGANDTVLVATRRAQHNLIEVSGSGSGVRERPGTRVRITSPRVPVGAHQLEVEPGHGFVVGDRVAVLRTPNDAWIDGLAMRQWGWTTTSYTIPHVRRITRIQGARLWIDIPIVDAIEDGFGGGAVFVAELAGRIAESGVEDLRLVSESAGPTDEDHAWTAVRLSRLESGWVRRVTAVAFGFAAVEIAAQSSFNTIEEVAMLDPVSQITGSRRYPFVVTDGLGNLFQRIYARNGRHSFVSGARVTGPNVWLDAVAVQTHSDDGPHHRWATGLLFDNTRGGPLHVQNRQSSGTGHGWAGAQVLFWNAVASQIICDAPLGAMNWSIGSVGSRANGSWAPGDPDGWFESHGTPVAPRSLYLQQLEDRLGRSAVEAVTLPAQREPGGLSDFVEQWAGEGRLEDLLRPDPSCARGLASGRACCAASCGTCGGTGCSQRPGGAAACCSGSITTAARSCAAYPPPCTLP
jgi:hypothetical protein